VQKYIQYTKPQREAIFEQLPRKGGCDEDTYSNCIKIKIPRSTPTSSTLPPRPAPHMLSQQRVETPIRYDNPFSPLCMEPSPLDTYVCPLFDCLDHLDNTSTHGIDQQNSPNASPKQDNGKSSKAKTPVWQLNQSSMLRSTALGVGLRKYKKVSLGCHVWIHMPMYNQVTILIIHPSFKSTIYNSTLQQMC
jgi:hypothetical protein